METLLRKQRSKCANPEGSNVAVSNLWFTVSGKIWKIEPSPEQTLKIVFTNGAPQSLYFSYICFDLRNSKTRMALRQDYRQCEFLFFLFFWLYHIVQKTYRKKVSQLYTCSLIDGLSIDEPTSLYLFLFQTSFNAHARCTRKCFCTARNNFFHRLTLNESKSFPSRTTVLYVQLRKWCMIYRSAPSFTADF